MVLILICLPLSLISYLRLGVILNTRTTETPVAGNMLESKGLMDELLYSYLAL